MSDLQPPYRPSFAAINLKALEHNYRALSTKIPHNGLFCLMVKANAYGHGDELVSKALESFGAKTFGVGLIEEGIILRRAGIKGQIIVFGDFDLEGFLEMKNWNLTPVVSSWEQIEIFKKQTNSVIHFHLKFDTGMHRLGFEPSQATRVREALDESRQMQPQALMTHCHSAENFNDFSGSSMAQLMQFQECLKVFADLNLTSHILNSAGALHFYNFKKNKIKLPEDIKVEQGIRVGLALYGYSPLQKADSGIDLKPVMSLRSKVVQTHWIAKGEGVSYGAKWVAPRRSLIGTVPIGYADGYHRILSQRSKVLILDQEVPVVGHVCMDYIMIDLTEIADRVIVLKASELIVTLFGMSENQKLLSAQDLAQLAQTIPWEILTSVGERVPRLLEGKSS